MFRFVLAIAASAVTLAAHGQVVRNFPGTALRGELRITAPPEVLLNGRSSRLSPGARIRGTDNMLAMSAALVDTRLPVHYTLDIGGEISEVWILRGDELANRPWPRTPKEAQDWLFDPVAQTWSRP